MRPRILLFSCLVFVAGGLNGQVGTPKVGVVRYADHSVHTIFGLDRNLIVSSEPLASADAASFSDFGGLLAKGGHIELVGADFKIVAEYDSGESAPLVNMDGDLTTAIAWLPVQNALLRWNGTSFVLTEVHSSLLSHVTSVRVENPNEASLLVMESGGGVSAATVSLQTGDLMALHLLAGVTGPAFAQHSFVVFHDQTGLEIVSSNGAVRTLPLAATDLTFERVSSDWVHLVSAATKRDWMLHLNDSALELSELPGPPASQEARK